MLRFVKRVNNIQKINKRLTNLEDKLEAHRMYLFDIATIVAVSNIISGTCIYMLYAK